MHIARIRNKITALTFAMKNSETTKNICISNSLRFSRAQQCYQHEFEVYQKTNSFAMLTPFSSDNTRLVRKNRTRAVSLGSCLCRYALGQT